MSSPLNLRAPLASYNIQLVLDRLALRGDETLLVTAQGEVSAMHVLEMTAKRVQAYKAAGVGSNSICAFVGDYSADTCAVFLALAVLGAVAVPFSAGTFAEQEELAEEVDVEFWIDPAGGADKRENWSGNSQHPLITKLGHLGNPGLIVFTSGSSGKPKAILHDINRVASKFSVLRPPWRMVMFLLMDHFGGFNTLMSVLANGSVGVCPSERTPRAVCEAIDIGKASLLPTTPTFLGMMIASGVCSEYNLSSLNLVTYGAEPMPPSTLAKIRALLPNAEFKQTYGLSELGVLRSTSPQQDSLWLKVGGDGFETRVVDGQLHIRSSSSMLGYINAPSPINLDGWMNTGDMVEQRDGLIRFIGRESEFINVGGQKVMPNEVENVLLDAEGVIGAVVSGERHPLMGQVVVARIAMATQVDLKEVTFRLRSHCRDRLQKFKIPLRFELVNLSELTTPRSKKNRA